MRLPRIAGSVGVIVLALALIGYHWTLHVQASPEPQGTETVRRVNAPYVAGAQPVALPRHAIFWLGEVDPTSNYSDVRVAYNDESLYVTMHIFDRLLWFTSSPTPATLDQWDAVTLYLNQSGNSGNAPQSGSYRFTAQLNNAPDRATYQAAWQGNGSGWAPVTTAFETTTGWRGEGLNDGTDDRGWTVTFKIPLASLSATSEQLSGTSWGLAVALHDRDSAAGPPVLTRSWPESATTSAPATWGQLRFGLPPYEPPSATGGSTVTIRQGLNGATVEDADVGGHTLCGVEFQAGGFFDGWGDANYAELTEINIQNQIDVADWPCFSKYYVTFPLDLVPPGKEIISATLTLNQFGGSHMELAQASLIQVLTVEEPWDEATVTWNNAPLPVENISMTRVEPLPQYPGCPGVSRVLDASQAVADAYAAGRPARMALYSADSAYHSGKHFSSSEANPCGIPPSDIRPTLRVRWGEPSGGPGPTATRTATVTPSPTATRTATFGPSPTPMPPRIYLPMILERRPQ